MASEVDMTVYPDDLPILAFHSTLTKDTSSFLVGTWLLELLGAPANRAANR